MPCDRVFYIIALTYSRVQKHKSPVQVVGAFLSSMSGDIWPYPSIESSLEILKETTQDLHDDY